ncbi:hypothetical protein AMATHDRAFT_9851 [Amanita thiersii Skay4041]|uniref:Uncharacterized protein n=1 Tax=Amanita thiersii Skay4041 TaxID=703135 RepID=A0A2A9N6E0_9AGAR|nr:hypothetical protein AMATHDRAFT_9851 [Amanita thiersii Skay4041]
MSTRGYSLSPVPSGHPSPNPFSTAISSLRSTYQTEAASEDALHYIDSVLQSKSNSPSNLPHGNMPHGDHATTNTQTPNPVTIPRPRSHSVTPKASPLVSPLAPHRPSSSTGIYDNKNNDGTISRMRSAAFDESQNIAQPVPTHPPPAFMSTDYIDSEINVTGTLISLPALMDKPQSCDFPLSTDPAFVLQNIYTTYANDLLQNKGYVPSIQVKDMGKALATHIRNCTGSGFATPHEERIIQMDLLARIMAYAAVDLNTEVADYTVAAHGSSVPLLIYREIQEEWDFSGNTDNYLVSDTFRMIQDDLDESFTNRQHKNIMAITTPANQFSPQDKHDIMDAITNETTLPDKWAFTDEKGHKRPTYAWLSGNTSPKKPVAPTMSFSPSIGQKRPLEDDSEDLSHNDRLSAIKYHLPLPKSTIEANFDAWTETVNHFLDTNRPLYPELNPTALRATVLQAAEKLMKREYFVNKIRKLARSDDTATIHDFKDERLRSLRNEVNLIQDTTPQDMDIEETTTVTTKTDLIRKSSHVWRNTAKTLWKDNILTCNQETLDQATRLLLLDDTQHKFAKMTEAQIYDTEVDRRDLIIQKITELNENASKAIKDIQCKSMPKATQDKIDIVKKQGWEAAKRTILQNPSKFSPPTINPKKYKNIVANIVDDLRNKEDDSWAMKIIKDVKNKGLQSQALEHRIHSIVRRLNNFTNANTSTTPPPLPAPTHIDEQMEAETIEMDPSPWTDSEEYKQNWQLWINTASEIFKKLSPYFTPDDRKHKEELYWSAADTCAHQDKDLIQLQSISSLTDTNKKRDLENTRRSHIEKEYQSLLEASKKQEATKKKDAFEDYLNTKDFDYYVQHAKDQLANPAVPGSKKSTIQNILKDAEKWQPKHRVDDDGSILPDSPPPSPRPKTKTGSKKTNSKAMAEMTRKGNTPNTRHLQKLLNEMNSDNGQKIMKEIHKISNKDKINTAQKQLVKPQNDKTSYAQKTATKTQKDPRRDGAGGWKTVGSSNKISRPTILPPPPNIFKFFITDDADTLPPVRQNEDELTSALNNIISENVEWLLELGSNHVKSANWSKDPRAIVISMTRNIDKNRTDDLPDGKKAFEALNEAVLDLFPGSTLANRKPRSKFRFTRIPTQHSDGLPMDNGLLYHYIRKHPNFENVRFSLTPRFERSRPLKPGQITRPEFTKTVVCESSSTTHRRRAKNSFFERMKTREIVKFANDGTTRQNFANQTHTFVKDVEGRIQPPCIRRPAIRAKQATYATSDV